MLTTLCQWCRSFKLQVGRHLELCPSCDILPMAQMQAAGLAKDVPEVS